ncbi:MAG: antibiotic biosynthesis monooxygenase [Actinomycetota bacterium]
MAEIIIAGFIRIHPDDRQPAVDAAADAIAGARTQPGCLAYSFVPDNHMEDAIVVYERWADQASLEAHFAGPWYKATGEVLRSHRLQGANEVQKFRIDKAEPVYDDTHTPRADFFTD